MLREKNILSKEETDFIEKLHENIYFEGKNNKKIYMK